MKHIRPLPSFLLPSWLISSLLCVGVLSPLLPLSAQHPLIEPKQDWLLQQQSPSVSIRKDDKTGIMTASNGIISRSWTTTPNVASVALNHLLTGKSYLRSTRPEAELTLNGKTYAVGGLTGQTVHNYLLSDWISELKPIPDSFVLKDIREEALKERLPWKKNTQWLSKDYPWPLKGKELIFTYAYPAENLPNDQAFLKDLIVEVHYEFYDGLPTFCKWLTLTNKSTSPVTIDACKSEILAAVEEECPVDDNTPWTAPPPTIAKPNIGVYTDYAFAGMSPVKQEHVSYSWEFDPSFTTQVNYNNHTPCLLVISPKIGPGITLEPGESFSSIRSWLLLHDSDEKERKNLEIRRFFRSLAPWTNENPILMHIASAQEAPVKKALDQCADVGFELAILTFGSGFNIETEDPNLLKHYTALADYAREKNIALGGYSLLASRSVNAENDVVMPEGRKPVFGHSPCLVSSWGNAYFDKLYKFYEQSGMNVLEHDGSYPGDICASTTHPGHKGLEDSQWRQHEKIKAFYHWCRGKGIYLNVPDTYFMNGSNKTGMGYKETNWSLPRAYQEIIERQNIYDGTYEKTPSMGWMFVPLIPYHGGGEAAMITPLHKNLAHYEQRLANLFGGGVQACYRGPELYDTPETRDVVKKWVDFYKKHRQVLDGDLIHLRRPDGQDYDGWLHVNPGGKEKGLAMIYNPLNEAITRTLRLPLYYTGLSKTAKLTIGDNKPKTHTLDRDYAIPITLTIPARSQISILIE